MPPTTRGNDASRGVVTSRDPAALTPGEMVAATGVEYRIGSPHLYKMPGRTYTGQALAAAPVISLVNLQYDLAADVLAAVSNGTIYESALSTTPSFSASSVTGLSPTALPQWSGFRERWFFANGVDSALIREPANVPGTSSPYRPIGLYAPDTPTYTIVTGASPVGQPTMDAQGVFGAFAKGFNNASFAYDGSSDTFAQGLMSYRPSTSATYLPTLYNNQKFPVEHIFKFSAQVGGTSRKLYIDHEWGLTFGSLGKWTSGDTVGYLAIDVSINSGASYTNVFTSSGNTGVRGIPAFDITDGADVSQVWVKFSMIPPVYVIPPGHTRLPDEYGVDATWNVFDIKITAGAQTPVQFSFPVSYGYTEVYIDSDNVEHQSNLSPAVVVPVETVTVPLDKYGVTLTLTKKNSVTQFFRVYRSVDEQDGGYPIMWLLSKDIPATQTTYTDNFDVLPTDIPFQDKGGDTALPLMTFLDQTLGSSVTEFSFPPPFTSVITTYQGSVIYVPGKPGIESRRLYYSLPATIQLADLEKVPPFYFLDFQTNKNDSIVTACTTNGGKSLLAFFANYTMLVNYLPQFSDGVFDGRVKEYVSNNRGCAGRLGCIELTLSEGQTIVAAVDNLGVWVTNGVSMIEEWSRDLDWATLMAGVDLTKAQMVDNTAMRRVELLYTDTLGIRQELHFFYGIMKEDGAGHKAPLIIGPTPMGVASRLYTNLSGAWTGFSGSSAADGKVFLEGGEADAANGYDSNGNIRSFWTLGDIYIDGLSIAQILEQGNPKFGDAASTKTYTLTGGFHRDKGKSYFKVKSYIAGSQQQVYWHSYADRHRVSFECITNTAAPPFIRYDVEMRDAGPTRDR